MVWVVPSHVRATTIVSQATTYLKEVERKSADQGGQITHVPIETLAGVYTMLY